MGVPRVDLSKATSQPTFSKETPNYTRILKGTKLELECEVRINIFLIEYGQNTNFGDTL